MMDIILASGSAGRKALFDGAGIKYIAAESGFDETEIMAAGLPPDITVERIAYNKALAACEKYDRGVIIAADTIVSLDGKIFGKPEGENGAFNMLKALAGKKQLVYTGVCVVMKNFEEKIFKTFHAVSSVKFINLSDGEIRAYAATGEPEGKSGSYTVLGAGAMLIESIEGEHTNVVGLPMSKLYVCLRGLGIDLFGNNLK